MPRWENAESMIIGETTGFQNVRTTIRLRPGGKASSSC